MAYNYGAAVNGLDDDSQNLYRRKVQTAALAASNSSLSRPASIPADPDAGQPASTAYNAGQTTRKVLGQGADAAGNALGYAAKATMQPALSIAQPIAQFARGVVGADPDKPLLSPISSANAAAPSNAPQPLTRTALPTMAVHAPVPSISAAPGVGDRVAAGRTFGTRAADGSTAFSNVPGAVGYDPGYNNAGDNIGIAPAAAAAPAPSLSGQLTRPANGAGDATAAAAQNANSDLASILNRDPRSALGIAARNAQVDAQSGFGSQKQRNAAYEQAIGGLVGQVGMNYKGSAQSTDEAQRGQNSLDTEALHGQNELANTNARSIAELSRPQYETDAQGNLVRVSGASATPVTGSDKTPLSVMGKINAPIERAHAEIYNRSLSRYLDANMSQDKAQEQAQADADAYKPPGAKGGAAAAKSATPQVPNGMKSFAGYSKTGNPVFVDANGNKHEAVGQ